jgi:hypothetical protein
MGFGTKVAAFERRNDAPADFRDRNVLLAFNASVPPADQDSILASAGATVLKRLGVDLIVVDVGSGQALGAIQKLKAHHQIRYAEPDYLQDLDAATMPNDTNVGIQWAVHNTGQTVNQFSGTAGADERTRRLSRGAH